MSEYPMGQTSWPPELPQCLKNVHDLRPIVGVPTEDQVIEIHAVMRMAHRVVDTKYRSKYPCSIFPLVITYTPPTLPNHVPISLQPVVGAPSNEQVERVHEAIRSYQRCWDVPLMFNTQLNAELSQHLFDIQMARYMQSATLSEARPAPTHRQPVAPPGSTRIIERTRDINDNSTTDTSYVETTASLSHQHRPDPSLRGIDLRDAIERSNQLAERANQLTERSNQLLEQSPQSADRHLEQSDRLIEHLTHLVDKSIEPVDRLGDTLKNINRVLVGIQHAIVRNHKNNTTSAVDCLVNEKGETPAQAWVTNFSSLTAFYPEWTSRAQLYHDQLTVKVDGNDKVTHVPEVWLGRYLRFYRVGENLLQDEEASEVLQERQAHNARRRLEKYLSSCLG